MPGIMSGMELHESSNDSWPGAALTRNKAYITMVLGSMHTSGEDEGL